MVIKFDGLPSKCLFAHTCFETSAWAHKLHVECHEMVTPDSSLVHLLILSNKNMHI